jgi:predicted DNA-binding transcriptional regulator YafY
VDEAALVASGRILPETPLQEAPLPPNRYDTMNVPPSGLSRSAERLRAAFDRGAALTKKQAARKMDCSERHVMRLLRELREEAGVPVAERREGRAKVFSVPAEHQRRRLQIGALDEEALRALVVAAEAARSLLRDTPLEAPIDRAFRTLLAAFGDEDVFSFEPAHEAQRWHFSEAAPPGGKIDVLRALDRCITESRSVRVDYTNGRGRRSTDRKLDPLALAPFPSGWQLAAWCHQRRAVRNFRPARIEGLRPCHGDPGGDHFAPPSGFDPDDHFGGRFGALEGDGRLHTVRLRVEPAVAQHFKSKPYHSSQRVEETGEDGALIVTYQVSELKAMRSFARSWGPNVTALEPPELVRRLAEDARRTAARYDDGATCCGEARRDA